MGANAQTSVPTFTAGEILTAANMNISASTGIPVFATTTTRDAAFGGTGEKTLAEGQFAYIENIAGSAATQYYDGAAWQTLVTGGLVCLKAETAFTSASSVTADSVFTSSYTNYLINVVFTSSASTGDLFIKLRVGGVSASTNYNFNYISWTTTVTAAQQLSQTSFSIADDAAATSSAQVTLFGPQLAAATGIQSQSIRNLATNDPRGAIYTGNHSTATAYDGIEILTTGTMTGTYTIYGYSKTV